MMVKPGMIFKAGCRSLFIIGCLFFVVPSAWAKKEPTPAPVQVLSAQIMGTVHDTREKWNPYMPENDMTFDKNVGLYSRIFYLSHRGGRNADGIYAIRFSTNNELLQVYKQGESIGQLTTGENIRHANNIIFKVTKEDNYAISFDPRNKTYNISPQVEYFTKIESMQLNGFVYDDQGLTEHSDARRTYPAEIMDETLASHDMIPNADGTWSKRVFLKAKGALHKDGRYQFLFSANHNSDWGYCAINGQPGKLCAGSGYDSKNGMVIDSGIVIKITEDGEYTFTVNPQEFLYTISPQVVCANNLNRIQINGSIIDEPWNPKAKEHEMTKGEDGIWRKKLKLSKKGGEAGNGIYVMNFSIDSEWFLDGIGMGGAWGKTWHVLPQESNIMFQVLEDGEYEIQLDTVKNTFRISPEVKPITKFYSLRIVGNFEEFENDGAGGWSPFDSSHGMQTSDKVIFFRDIHLIKGKTYQYKYTANDAGWGWVFNDYPWDGYKKLALHGSMAAFEFKPNTTGMYRFFANIVTGEYSVKKIE